MDAQSSTKGTAVMAKFSAEPRCARCALQLIWKSAPAVVSRNGLNQTFINCIYIYMGVS